MLNIKTCAQTPLAGLVVVLSLASCEMASPPPPQRVSAFRCIEPYFPPQCPDSPSEAKDLRYKHCIQRVKDTVYFSQNSAMLSEGARAILKGQARWLRMYQGEKAILEGHADEQLSLHANYLLGKKRAEAVKQYLIRLGIDRARLKAVSYGNYQPATPDSASDERAINRKVVSLTEEQVKERSR